MTTVCHLEAFQQLKLSDIDSCLNKIKSISEKNSHETGGVITNTGIHVFRNIAENPCCFYEADAEEFFTVFTRQNVLILWHSHTFGPEKPSNIDISVAKEFQLPCLVYSTITKHFALYEHKNNNTVYFSF